MTESTVGTGQDRTGATALFVLEPIGTVRDSNQPACALVQMSADRLRGLPFATFVGVRDREQFVAMEKELGAGRAGHHRTVLHIGPPGVDGTPAPGTRACLVRVSGLTGCLVVAAQPLVGGPHPPPPAAVDAAAPPASAGVSPTPRGASPTPVGASLTAVEASLLELVAQGLTTAQIATRLHYSTSNVGYHLAGLGARFGTHNRTELVSRAYVLGCLRTDAWPPRATRAADQPG
jgi:DNA-binding CsgD family transcriptional regulator